MDCIRNVVAVRFPNSPAVVATSSRPHEVDASFQRSQQWSYMKHPSHYVQRSAAAVTAVSLLASISCIVRCHRPTADRPTVCQWQLARRPPTRRYTSSTRWQYSCWHFDYRCCFNRRSIARRCDACCNGSRRAGEIPAKNPSQSLSDNQKHRPLMQYRCHIALQ